METKEGQVVLGRGAFGVVLLEEKDGKQFAVKKIKLPLKHSISSIFNEINMLRICSHPNIIKLHDVRVNKFSTIDFRLEYANGGTIKQGLHRFK